MILEIMRKIVPFTYVLVAFVVATSISFMAFRAGDPYEEYWQAAYKMAYGDFDALADYDSHGFRVFFLIATYIITLVLLNMLIAIMSDVYERVQSTKKKEDVRERIQLIAELGKFMFWAKEKPQEKTYIHHCTTEKLQRQTGWEGKIKILQRDIEKVGSTLKRMIFSQNQKIDILVSQNQELRNHVDERLISSQNEKIDKLIAQNEEMRSHMREELDVLQHQMIDQLAAQNENLRWSVEEGNEQNHELKKSMAKMQDLLKDTIEAKIKK